MQVVDIEKMKTMQMVDLATPPMKTVPDEFWPRLVYKYPKEHYRVVTLRPTNAPPVERLVQNDPKILKVHNDKEFKEALKAGWKDKAFVPRPLEDSEAGIEYE